MSHAGISRTGDSPFSGADVVVGSTVGTPLRRRARCALTVVRMFFRIAVDCRPIAISSRRRTALKLAVCDVTPGERALISSRSQLLAGDFIDFLPAFALLEIDFPALAHSDDAISEDMVNVCAGLCRRDFLTGPRFPNFLIWPNFKISPVSSHLCFQLETKAR